MLARKGAPTVVVFHGNGEQLANIVPLAQDLSDYGLGTFAVEYPGYGLSAGSRTTEKAVYADASAAIAHLQQQLGVPRERIVLLGQSLGSAVAVEMALRGLGARLIVLAPFTSMADMARKIAPILPTQWLVLDRYDTLSKAPHITMPTLLVHGDADTVVPVAMGKKVARALPSGNSVWLPGANHNDLYEVGGPDLNRRIAQFASGSTAERHKLQDFSAR